MFDYTSVPLRLHYGIQLASFVDVTGGVFKAVYNM